MRTPFAKSADAMVSPARPVHGRAVPEELHGVTRRHRQDGVLVDAVLDHGSRSWGRTQDVPAEVNRARRFQTARKSRGRQPEGTDGEGALLLWILADVGARDCHLPFTVPATSGLTRRRPRHSGAGWVERRCYAAPFAGASHRIAGRRLASAQLRRYELMSVWYGIPGFPRQGLEVGQRCIVQADGDTSLQSLGVGIGASLAEVVFLLHRCSLMT